jgi:ABC-2 type transport system permease protein
VVVALVRLQLALRRRTVGFTGTTQRALFLLRWLAAVGLGLAGASLVAAADWLRPSSGTVAVAGVLNFVFLLWALLPLTAPSLSGSGLDPRRLLGYPAKNTEQLLAGVIGTLIGPAGLATFLTAAGVVVASTQRWQDRLVVLPAAVLFTLACVTTSLAVRGLVENAAARRPARLLAAAVLVVVVLWIAVAAEAAGGLAPLAARLGDGPWDTVLGLLPSGAAADLTEGLRTRRWLAVGLALVDLLLVLVVTSWLTLWSISRWVDLPPSRLRRWAAAPTQLRLLPFPLNLGRPGAVLAASGQQLRYFFLRAPLGVRAVLLLPVLGLVVATGVAGSFGVVAGTVALAVIAVPTTTFNAFGLDAGGLVWLVHGGAPLRRVLAGKQFAAGVCVSPLLVGFVVARCLVAGEWEDSLQAVLLGTAVVTVGSGIGALTSVLAPYDLTRPRRAGLLRTLLTTAVGVVLLVGATGGGALAWVLADQLPQTLLAVLLLLAAAGFWLLAVWVGGRLAQRRQERLVEAMSPLPEDVQRQETPA